MLSGPGCAIMGRENTKTPFCFWTNRSRIGPYKEVDGMRVLLIIPAYNEEANIKKVIERVREVPGALRLCLGLRSHRRRLPGQHRPDLPGGGGFTSSPCSRTWASAGRCRPATSTPSARDTTWRYSSTGTASTTWRACPSFWRRWKKGECDFCVGSRFLEGTSQFQSHQAPAAGDPVPLLPHPAAVGGPRSPTPTSGFRAANKKVIAALADYYPH